MRVRIVLQSILFLICMSGSVHARELVLIGPESLAKAHFNKTELRRLFLGFMIYKNGEVVNAFRNDSSEKMDNVFMQHVMFMSRKNYERRLLSLKFKKGNRDIKALDTTGEVLSIISRNKYSVSYAWSDEIADKEGIHVLQVLWKGAK